MTDTVPQANSGCRTVSLRPKCVINVLPKSSNLVHTWKFFSDHPFLPRNLTTTSESSDSADDSTQPVISSNVAKRVFQFESPRPVANSAGIMSAARASASSGVCLNLKVSNDPWAGGAPPFAGLAAAAGTIFLTCGAAAAGAEGAGLPESPPSEAVPAGFFA